MTQQATISDIAAMMSQSEPEQEPTDQVTEQETESEADDVELLEDDQESIEDSEEEPLYTVKVDGEELEVSLDELLSGYSRESDYRRKTTKLSEDRKQNQAEIEAAKAKIDETVQELSAFIEQKESELSEELMVSNPGEYLRQKTELDKAKQARDAAQEQRSAELQAKQQALVEQESQILVEKMGGDKWTPEKRQADMALATKYLQEKGITEQEMSTLVDHRLWLVALEAAQASKLKTTHERVKESRKTPKSVKPSQPLTASERKVKEISERVATGKTRKARIGALAELMGN